MRTRRDDTGQAVTAILMVVSLLLLSLLMIGLIPLGRATDQKSTLQSAADASALAGAQDIIENIPARMNKYLDGHQQPFSCTDGQSAAAAFALKNDAVLVSYSACPGSNVKVTVRSQNDLISGKREDATAESSIGVKVAPCVEFSAPLWVVKCGPLTVPYVKGTPSKVGIPPGQVKKMFSASLVD